MLRHTMRCNRYTLTFSSDGVDQVDARPAPTVWMRLSVAHDTKPYRNDSVSVRTPHPRASP